MSLDIHGLRIYTMRTKTILRYLVLGIDAILEDSDYECPYCGLFQQNPQYVSITNSCPHCDQENSNIQIVLSQLAKIKEILEYPNWTMLEYESEYENIQKLFLDSRKYASDEVLSSIIGNAVMIISEWEYYKLRNLC